MSVEKSSSIEAPEIVVTATELPVLDLTTPAGVLDGTILETPAGERNEVVVNDLDADDNVIGWHKEIV